MLVKKKKKKKKKFSCLLNFNPYWNVWILNFMFMYVFCNFRTFSVAGKPNVDEVCLTYINIFSKSPGKIQIFFWKKKAGDLFHISLALQCWDMTGCHHGAVSRVLGYALKPLKSLDEHHCVAAPWAPKHESCWEVGRSQMQCPLIAHKREDRQILGMETSLCSFRVSHPECLSDDIKCNTV